MMQTQAWSGQKQVELTRAHSEAARQSVPTAHSMEREILQAVQNKVFCLCLGFIGNTADALDLTQDTLTKALVHYRQANPEFVQAWIMRIARNLCLDHLRRRKVRGPQQSVCEHMAIEWQTPEDHANSREDIQIVRRAIAQLPPRLREVLVMREYGELSYLEIGRALHIGRGTVTSRLNRARRAVLHHYQESMRATASTWRDHDHH